MKKKILSRESFGYCNFERNHLALKIKLVGTAKKVNKFILRVVNKAEKKKEKMYYDIIYSIILYKNIETL